MGQIKGITVGTYLTKTKKNNTIKGHSVKEICNKCKYRDICKYKEITRFKNEKTFENNVECNNFYFAITKRAIVSTGRDAVTGKRTSKTFIGETEKEAFNKALAFQIEMEKNGGFKKITKSNKSIYDLVKSVIEEDYRLGKIKGNTKKRKMDTLLKLQKERFVNIPIVKVQREDVLRYLETLKPYSKSTIKQVYELICMAFGQAKYENIITDNFMEGYKRVEKPKSEYKSHKRKSLTIEEQKKLVDYLNKISYEKCSYKYLILLILTTGIRIGEALVIDYEKDISISENKIDINRTQTKDENGNIIIGETTKTNNSRRTLILNSISKEILEKALIHKIPNKDNLLFCQKNGSMHLENSINSCLKRICLKLEIGIYEDYNKNGKLMKKTDVHTHMLRGTFATRCAEAKIAPAVLMKILGHKDIKVTMEYYIDVDAEFQKSENENIKNYLLENNIFGIEFNT